MLLMQIMASSDDSWDLINRFGNLNCGHFLDLNTSQAPHEKKYASVIERVNEIQKKIEYIFNY